MHPPPPRRYRRPVSRGWRAAAVARRVGARPYPETAMTALPDPLRAAKSLRPILEAQSDATDGDLTLTKPCVEALAETKLFHVMVPKELGGLEADTDTLIDVFEELAHQ